MKVLSLFKKHSKIVKLFFIWRLWLFIPLCLAFFFLPFRENSLFTTIWQYTDKYPVVENHLIYPWSNFDGVHYLAIASRGYLNEGRFLPLFPMLIRLLILPLTLIWKVKPYGHLVFWTSFLLSNSFFILSLIYLKKLLKLDYKEKVVNKIILLLLLFPTSFFFVTIYTESLFLLLTTLTLYFARKRKWYTATIFSMLLSITRLPGVLILIPLLYEYITLELKIKIEITKLRKVTKEIFSIKNIIKLFKFILIPLPLIIYAIFNYYKWQDPLYFIHAHGALGNSRAVNFMVFPLITIYRYIKIFLTVSTKQYEFWVALIEFLSLIVALTGITFAYLKKVRPSYLLYSIAIISLPLLSGTLTGFPRYLLLSFPIFIGITLQINKNKWLWKILLISSLISQAIFLMLFSRGWFIA